MTALGARTRLLLADAEPLLREIMADALGRAGYDVQVAANGIDARRSIEDPDGLRMVVTDIDMAGFGGFDVAYGARERDAAVPILFVTNDPDEAVDRNIPAPCYCLAKPFSAAVLVEVVDRLLTSHSGGR